MDAEDAAVIGARARKIRRRRGMSLDVAAGLAGISEPYLGMLEQGSGVQSARSDRGPGRRAGLFGDGPDRPAVPAT